MAEGLLNAFWRGLLSQSANATTEINTNENEVCRRLILSGITVSAAGVITIPGLTIGTIVVAGGGTGVTTLTNHGVVLGQGTSPVVVTTPGTTGQLLTGVTGGDPTFQTPAVPVTSVALTVPAEFSVAGSPVTTTGTLAVSKATQTANTVWAGPTSGGVVVPAFRALVVADLPVTDVPHGGTGVATLAAHGVVVGNGTGVVAVTGAGTTGQLLTSNGASADPTFQTLAAPVVLDRSTTAQDVSNTASATDVYSFAVPGGTLSTTGVLRLTATGSIDNASGGGVNLTMAVTYGATTLYTNVIATIANNAAIVSWRATVWINANNATNSQRGLAEIAIGTNGANTDGAAQNVSVNAVGVHSAMTEDSTASKNLKITVTWASANSALHFRRFLAITEKL